MSDVSGRVRGVLGGGVSVRQIRKRKNRERRSDAHSDIGGERVELNGDLGVDIDREGSRADIIVNEMSFESPRRSLEVALESADEEDKVGGLDFLAHRLQRVGTGVATPVQRVVFVEHRLAHCLGQYLRNITK